MHFRPFEHVTDRTVKNKAARHIFREAGCKGTFYEKSIIPWESKIPFHVPKYKPCAKESFAIYFVQKKHDTAVCKKFQGSCVQGKDITVCDCHIFRGRLMCEESLPAVKNDFFLFAGFL